MAFNRILEALKNENVESYEQVFIELVDNIENFSVPQIETLLPEINTRLVIIESTLSAEMLLEDQNYPLVRSMKELLDKQRESVQVKQAADKKIDAKSQP